MVLLQEILNCHLKMGNYIHWNALFNYKTKIDVEQQI